MQLVNLKWALSLNPADYSFLPSSSETQYLWSFLKYISNRNILNKKMICNIITFTKCSAQTLEPKKTTAVMVSFQLHVSQGHGYQGQCVFVQLKYIRYLWSHYSSPLEGSVLILLQTSYSSQCICQCIQARRFKLISHKSVVDWVIAL